MGDDDGGWTLPPKQSYTAWDNDGKSLGEYPTQLEANEAVDANYKKFRDAQLRADTLPPLRLPESATDVSRGWLWIAPIVEVLIVGLGIFLHLWVEALLLVNVAIGAFGIVILSLQAFGGNTKKSVWLTWIPTVGIGLLVVKGSLPSGDFMLWLAIMGASLTIYSVYRLATGKRL